MDLLKTEHCKLNTSPMKSLLALLLTLPAAHAMEMKPAEPTPTPSTPAAAEEASETFPASIWKVTTLDGTAPLADHPITFAIDAEGQINGNASCNRFGGAGQFGDSTVEIGPLRTTRRACEPDIMRQEQKFLALLSASTTWQIAGQNLLLKSPEGEIQAARQDAADLE
jgi:heat shock protein HslJ